MGLQVHGYRLGSPWGYCPEFTSLVFVADMALVYSPWLAGRRFERATAEVFLPPVPGLEMMLI